MRSNQRRSTAILAPRTRRCPSINGVPKEGSPIKPRNCGGIPQPETDSLVGPEPAPPSRRYTYGVGFTLLPFRGNQRRPVRMTPEIEKSEGRPEHRIAAPLARDSHSARTGIRKPLRPRTSVRKDVSTGKRGWTPSGGRPLQPTHPRQPNAPFQQVGRTGLRRTDKPHRPATRKREDDRRDAESHLQCR